MQEIIAKERLPWIDIAKGVGILLVMIGHTDIPMVMSNFIYAFHMPLFFMASGWTTNWEKYNFKEFISKRFRTLMVPFFIYSLIVILTMQKIGAMDLMTLLKEGWGGYALWFVPVFFFATVFAKIVVSFAQKELAILAGAVILMFFGALLKYVDFYLPWSLCSVPYATSLVLYGSLLKKYKDKVEYPHWLPFVLSLIVTLVVSYFYRLDIAWNNITPVLILTIGALSGCLMASYFSVFVANKTKILSRVLQEIGKETFLILAFCQVIHIAIRYYLNVGTGARYLIFIIIMVLLKIIKDTINKCLKFKLL